MLLELMTDKTTRVKSQLLYIFEEVILDHLCINLFINIFLFHLENGSVCRCTLAVHCKTQEKHKKDRLFLKQSFF